MIRSTLAAIFLTVGTLSISMPDTAYAHSGRTAADGCHKNSKTGTRHCHGKKAKPAAATKKTNTGEVYYANCAAARAAGAAPVRRGEPGYGRHLDRDNDGIGCE